MAATIENQATPPELTRESFLQTNPGGDVPEKASVHPELHIRPPVRVHLLVALMTFFSRFSVARIAGLKLSLGKGVCNPSPLPRLSLARLYECGVSDVEVGDTVLDIGTGSGVWALLAARRGGAVTATELCEVPLALVEENATKNGGVRLELLQGDLFEPVSRRRFKRILFNPPFHFGTPRNAAERAYLGGPKGDVLRRFFEELPTHLEQGGSACIILPEIEHRHYASALKHLRVVERGSKWVPILGRVKCLELMEK